MRTRLLAALLLTATSLASGPVPITIDYVPAIMSRIAKKEGYGKPGTIPTTHNNPGALVYARQRNAVPGEFGQQTAPFARFKTPRDGFLALERDIRAKIKNHVPLSTAWEYLKGL